MLTDSMITAHAKVAVQRATRYRWVVLAIIFLFYMMNFADRSNIGVALPMITKEFKLSHFEAGSLMSFFFLGYALFQIPSGLAISKFGTRWMVSLSVLGFSICTYLIGGSASAAMMKWFRFSLGVCESPSPIGGSATIKNWYPPKEQGTATGVFFAATSLALIAVPPVAVWIMTHYGWRMVFYSFAIPGIVIALLWYLLVHTRPEESPHCNATEVEYIRKPPAAVQFNSGSNGISVDSLGWLDRIIRAKRVPCMETNREVFRTWNVWGASLAYFCICMVTYGMMTWIPTYLVTGKGYTFARMGWVASMPWIGALVGQLAGGWFSDKVLRQRRKPLLMFAPISLIVMMVVLLNAPNSVSWLAFILFLTGVLVNTCLPSYFAYPMGMTTGKTYPTALSVLTFVGNLGGFFSPMIMGYLLDVYKNFNVLFIYLAVCALLSLVMTTTIAEPIQSST